MSLLLVMMLILVAGITPATSAIYTLGPDQSQQFATVAAQLQPGDTLLVESGVYPLFGPTPIPSGTPSAWVQVRTAPGATARVVRSSPMDGATIRLGPGTHHVSIEGDFIFDGVGFDLTGATFITLRDLEITHVAGSSILGCAYCAFINLHNHHSSGHGLMSWGAGNRIEGGFWHHHPRTGVSIGAPDDAAMSWGMYNHESGGLVDGGRWSIWRWTIHLNYPGAPISNWVIRRVQFTEILDAAIFCNNGIDHLFSNNLFYNNAEAAINCHGTGLRVLNNTFVRNMLTGTISNQGTLTMKPGLVAGNNIFWQNRKDLLYAGEATPDNSTLTTNLQGVDPLFVNNTGNDFRLTTNSPARNAGTTFAAVPDDFLRALRPVGGTYDIGAYEFGGVVTCTKPGGDCTAPSVPQNVALTLVSPTQIDGHWSDSSGSPVGYRVFRCQTPGCTPTTLVLSPTASAFSNPGLTPDTTYTYSVASVDAVDNVSEASSPVSLQTTAPGPDVAAPSVPTGLSCVAQSANQIACTWTASTDNVAVTGYRVRRCDATAVPGCTPATQVGTTNTPSFTSTNLSASTAYRVTVAAEDAAGNVSDYSSVASATTLAPPVTPETVLLLNNDVQDSSGQGHHGTNTGVAFDATNTREGSHAALFDATTDRITVPMTAFLTPNQLTIAVNVRPTSFDHPFQYIVGHTTTPYFANRIQLCVNATGMLGVGLGSSAGCGLNPSVMQLALNTWYHLVLRLNNGTYTIDVDGVRKASGTYVGLTTLAPTLTLGNNQGPNTQGWLGQMDGFTVVGRSWSDAEVDADCDLYVPGGCNTPPPTFDPFVMLSGVQGDGVSATNNERIIVTMQGVPDPAACQGLSNFAVAYAQVREPVITCTLSDSTLTLGVANPPETPRISLALTYLASGQQIALTNQTVADPTVGDHLQQVSWWCRPDGPTDDEPWLGLPNTLCKVPSPGVLNLRVDVVNVGVAPSPEQAYKLYCDTDVGDQTLAQRITEVFPSPIGIFLNKRTEGVVLDGTPRTPVLPAITGVTAVTAGTMERDDQSSISPVLAPQTRTEYEFSLAFMADIPRGTVFSCGLRAGDAGIPLSQTNLATIRIDHTRWLVR